MLDCSTLGLTFSWGATWHPRTSGLCWVNSEKARPKSWARIAWCQSWGQNSEPLRQESHPSGRTRRITQSSTTTLSEGKQEEPFLYLSIRLSASSRCIASKRLKLTRLGLCTLKWIILSCRYISTRSGALFSYPGTPNFRLSPLTREFFDPRGEQFYQTSSTTSSVVSISSPRLDFGGAGHVVTVSAPLR